jgi:signal peptidase I
MPKRNKLSDPRPRRPEPARKPDRPSAPASAQASSLSKYTSPSAIRETVESVIVAFVLAFLFRTFEAEAFVIPTGSMAPTLMGRHMDVECPKCGHEYQISASEQQDENGDARPTVVRSGTCPMCRFTADLMPGNWQGQHYASYNGDRILVGKFAYDFEEPKRWDVIVFRYPGDPATNYIKRLVGLPGETIRISHGNVWIRRGDGPDGPFEIARKESPQKLQAVLQAVFDNDLMPKIAARGWPDRWQLGQSSRNGEGDWTAEGDGSFRADGGAAGETWIRYHHLAPSYQQWQEMERGDLKTPLRPRLISDFVAYNTAPSRNDPQLPPPGELEMGAPPNAEGLGLNWVGDLALQCTVRSQSDSGRMVFDLVRGGRHFQCGVDMKEGTATLRISGLSEKQFAPAAPTALKGRGKHNVLFANVDDQLRLLVDGSEVRFDAPTDYPSDQLRVNVPNQEDLAPAGIASEGADVRVSHLRVLRDIYYIAAEGSQLADFRSPPPDLSDPSIWPRAFSDDNMKSVEFSLAAKLPGCSEKDQFFVLGDNSPQSKDGRLWGAEYWVNREMLIGKALYIYWPHSWGQFPGALNALPGWPNWRRMHLVE